MRGTHQLERRLGGEEGASGSVATQTGAALMDVIRVVRQRHERMTTVVRTRKES